MADVFMARQCKNGLVKVIIGDISKIEADVMVTTANNRLAGQEGVDAAIHKQAGPELRAACDAIAVERRKENMQPCPVGTSVITEPYGCLLYTSPSPRDRSLSRMPSSA